MKLNVGQKLDQVPYFLLCIYYPVYFFGVNDGELTILHITINNHNEI